jgi:translation elongation factor EF-Tu-like GTPase
MVRTEDGGRKSPISSGYRPNCWFGVVGGAGKEYNDCEVLFEDRPNIPPGEDADVWLRPYHPELVRPLVTVGEQFDICEGLRVVARGVVIATDDGPGGA